jgi:hypothetical protein
MKVGDLVRIFATYGTVVEMPNLSTSQYCRVLWGGGKQEWIRMSKLEVICN